MNRDFEKRLGKLEIVLAPVEVEAVLFCEPSDGEPTEGDIANWLAEGRARLTANGRVCIYGKPDTLTEKEWEARYCA